MTSFLLFVLGAHAAAAPRPASSLTVAAAASVAPALEAMGPLFELETGGRLVIIAAASGKLAVQAERGAPFDAFVAADLETPARLARQGLTDGPATVYTRGSLVVWSLREDIELSGDLAALASPAVRKLAVADPRTAPYGRAAVQALKAARLWPALEGKLVYGESAAQAAQFVASGAAEAGLVPKSAVVAGPRPARGRWLAVDRSLYDPLEHGFVVFSAGSRRHPGLCRAFVRLVTGARAQAILRAYGFD